MYGAALYRLRPADFGEVQHGDGLSPAWPVGYDDFEPWYTKAEWLYQVHGAHGEDPTEGHWSRPYPWPAVSHEPRIQQIADAMRDAGYHPFAAPCGILLDEERRPGSACIRCATCDGYPCLVHAKSDAETIAVRPILGLPNVTQLVNAEVRRLETVQRLQVLAGPRAEVPLPTAPLERCAFGRANDVGHGLIQTLVMKLIIFVQNCSVARASACSVPPRAYPAAA